MSLAFWLVAGLASVLALALLAQALQVRGYYRPIDSDQARERPPVSLVVWLEGAASAGAAHWLHALRPARGAFAGDEGWLAYAAEDAAAGEAAQALLASEPQVPVSRVLLVARTRAHAIEQALAHAREPLLGFAEGSCWGNAPLLDEGVRTAEGTQFGLAFALPYQARASTLGGALLAAYQNALVAPSWGVVAFAGSPRFAFEGFWTTTRSGLSAATAAGNPEGTHALARGRALALAFARQERRNRVLRRTLARATPALRLPAAWVALQREWRALPIGSGARRALLALSWSPLALAALAALLGTLAPSIGSSLAVAPLLWVVMARAAALLSLNGSVYRGLPKHHLLLAQVLLEGLVLPMLWLRLAFRR